MRVHPEESQQYLPSWHISQSLPSQKAAVRSLLRGIRLATSTPLWFLIYPRSLYADKRRIVSISSVVHMAGLSCQDLYS